MTETEAGAQRKPSALELIAECIARLRMTDPADTQAALLAAWHGFGTAEAAGRMLREDNDEDAVLARNATPVFEAVAVLVRRAPSRASCPPWASPRGPTRRCSRSAPGSCSRTPHVLSDDGTGHTAYTDARGACSRPVPRRQWDRLGPPDADRDASLAERVAAGGATHEDVLDRIRERTSEKGDESPAIS